MNKKILVSLSIILFTIFSFTICQATDDVMKGATNNIRNFVGGVENTVENAALGASNVSKNITSGAENKMDAVRTDSTMGTGYNAARTSTDTTTVAGMSQTAWTWLILGVAAIAIIAVVGIILCNLLILDSKGNNNNNDDDNI